MQHNTAINIAIQMLTILFVVATMGYYKENDSATKYESSMSFFGVDAAAAVFVSTEGYDENSAADSNELLLQIKMENVAIVTTTERPSDEMNVIREETHMLEKLQIKRATLPVTTSTAGPGVQTTTLTTPTTTAPTPPIPQKLKQEALKTTAATIRSYLGMQSNVTLSKLGKSKGSSSSSSSSSGQHNQHLHQHVLKPQKTDAPMLNYIFDSFSSANKHHHHDQRYGPHFEDILTDGNVTNITVQAGSNVYLNCRISLLQDKTVSWVKRKSNNGEHALQLLTVGLHTYSGDSRYKMEFQYPNNWRLKIERAQKSDEGNYECQISTHPPRVIQVNLHVNAPQVRIVDEYGALLQEKYYKIDSTLQLSCIVRNVVMSSSVVYWSHGEDILNYDTTRGGVSVKTELMESGANSTLFIARINKADSGNYTCSINPTQEYSIQVHILNGESFAELHHGSSSRVRTHSTIKLYIFLFFVLTIIHHRILQNYDDR